ncbi:MAG: hypothetical protein DBX47_05630 [Clostridiales bacterium]|nr:MAG: hypothetical protein DBX47_05630 [Clostridiales bacterium]
MFKKIMASVLCVALVFSLAVFSFSAQEISAEQKKAKEYMTFLECFFTQIHGIEANSYSDEDLGNLITNLYFAYTYGVSEKSLNEYIKEADKLVAESDFNALTLAENLLTDFEKPKNLFYFIYDLSFYTEESSKSYKDAKANLTTLYNDENKDLQKIKQASINVLKTVSQLVPTVEGMRAIIKYNADNMREFFPAIFYSTKANVSIDGLIKTLNDLAVTEENLTIDEFNDKIKDFMMSLGFVYLDKSELGFKVDSLNEYSILPEKEEFYPESYEVFLKAYNKCIAALEAKDYTNLNELLDSFIEAADGLQKYPLYILQEFLYRTQFDLKNEQLYTVESFSIFKSIYDEAVKAVAESQNPADEKFSELNEKLSEAYFSLQMADDFDYWYKYFNMLERFEGLNKDDYIAASWAQLQSALDAYKKLLDDGCTNSEEYENAYMDFETSFQTIEYIPYLNAMQTVLSIKMQYMMYSPAMFYPAQLSALLSAIEDLENAIRVPESDERLTELSGIVDERLADNVFIPVEYAKNIVKFIDFILELMGNNPRMFTAESWEAFQQGYESLKKAIEEAVGFGSDELYAQADDVMSSIMTLEPSPIADAISDLSYYQTLISEEKDSISPELLPEAEAKVKELERSINEDSDEKILEIYAEVSAYMSRYIIPHEITGDVNADNEVSLADAMLTFQNVAGKADLKGSEIDAADIDSNGMIDLSDAMKIFQYVAGKIDIL